MRADGRQPAARLRGDLRGGRGHGRASPARSSIIQYSVHPYFGAAFGPLTFMICVLGGLGNMVGAFIASFIMSEIISIGGVLWSTEMGYVIAFVALHRHDVRPPGRHPRAAGVSRRRAVGGRSLPRRCSRPVPALSRSARARASTSCTSSSRSSSGRSSAGAWSLMGRFGLVSLGHGAFLGHRRLHHHAPVELLRPDALARRAWWRWSLTVAARRWSSPTRAPASRSWATTSASSRWRWARSSGC